MKVFISVFLLVVGFSSQAFSWGGRAHAALCEAAVFLVESPNLKEYLLNKPHMMGHLCNIPDIYWRSLPSNLTMHGNPTHYVEPEMIGLQPKEVPTDFSLLMSKYTGQENKVQQIKNQNVSGTVSSVTASAGSSPSANASSDTTKISSLPLEMGTNWWRADQFFRIALAAGKDLKNQTPPANSKEEQNDTHEYNKSFYNMIVAMGLMGHYVGDNSQPFHVSSDYDGYAAGHGGIHAYYEDASVAYFGPDLAARIVKAAKSMRINKGNAKFLQGKNTVEKMRALGEISASEAKAILKVDPVLKPSSLKFENGISKKIKAERRPATVGYQKFEKLMVNQLGRGAKLLAHLWDQAFIEAGSPEVKAYKSYRYPLMPDFVMPDYYEIKSEIKTKADAN